MKLNLNRKYLLDALNLLRKVAVANRTHAVLGNVALIADTKTLRLVGMDLEKRMDIMLACKSKDVGSITVNCAALAETLSLRSEPDVEISADESRMTIRVGKHVGNRPGLPAEELLRMWPEATKGPYKFTIPAELLKEALTKCAIQAGAITGERAFLNSVFFVARNGLLNIQATDGRRLIIFYTSVPFEVKDEKADMFVIPKESVSTLATLTNTGEVEFELGDNLLTAATDSARFSSKLLEAKFQNFENIFPKDDQTKIKIVCEREQLIMELKTALQYGEIGMPSVSIACDKKEITVKAQGKDVGMGETPFDARKGSDEIQFSCNPVLLLDALNAFPDEEVTLQFKDAITPFVIKNDLITTVVYPQRLA